MKTISPTIDNLQEKNKKLIVAIICILAAIAANIFALAYVYGEQPAYIWDSRSYWEKYFECAADMQSGVLHAIKRLIKDIWVDDNNELPSFLLLPLYPLFGKSREAYISGIVTLYLVPASVLAAVVCNRAVNVNTKPEWNKWFLVFFALVACCPQFWAPTLEGLPDMIACIPLFLFILIFMDIDLNEPQPIRRLLVFGVLLWLPFLFRRWFAYTVISLASTTALFGLYDYYVSHGHWRLWQAPSARLIPWQLIKNLAPVYLVAGLCVLILQGGFVDHILHTPYADIYSAYQVLDWRQHFVMFYNHFGPFPILVAIVGSVVGVMEKKTRRITLFALLNIVVTAKLFTMTQAFSSQHYIPIAAWLLILSAIGIYLIWGRLQNKSLVRAGLVSLFVLIYAVYFVHMFIRDTHIIPKYLMTEFYYQRRVDNYSEYARLTSDLEALLGDKGKLTVLASNGYLCDSIFQSLSYERLTTKIHYASQVDKRDLFDLDELKSDYVVVADPIQTHMRPADQQVIIVPATQMLAHTGIGLAYEKLPNQYHLANGVTAYIYKKVRPFKPEEIQGLLDELFKSYPDWKQKYGAQEIAKLTAS